MTETPTSKIEWQTGPVPDQYRGLWRRRLLTREDGSRDADTIVWWLQTGQLFADIRLPADRSVLDGATCFAELDETALSCLVKQEGFAGLLEWTDKACAWRRKIDYRPLPGPPDEGWMEDVGHELMLERGMHREYAEEWVQTAATDAVMNDWFWHDGWDGATLLRIGSTFMLVDDHRPGLPNPETFETDVLAAAGDETALAALLNCEISFGKIKPDGYWRIQHSTIPWREGEIVSGV